MVIGPLGASNVGFRTMQSGNLLFLNTGGSELMRLTQSGTLLIGTTASPTSGAIAAVLNNSGGGGGIQVTYNNNGGGAILGSSGGGLNFFTFTGATGSESYTSRLIIDSSGNLTCYNNIIPSTVSNTGGGTWQFGSGAWSGSSPASTSVNSVTGIVYSGGSGSQLFTLSSGSGQTSLELDGTIFVGDGISYNPLSLTGASAGYLAVANGGSFGGSLYVNGSIYATSDITAYYSDERLKTNIEPIVNALAKIKTLKGITYYPNELASELGGDDSKVQRVGVIAQDVAAVLPQIVKAAPFDIGPDGTSKSGENYLTVQYDKLTALLIEAVKELGAKVEQLQGEINQLKG